MKPDIITKLLDIVIGWLPTELQDKAKGARKALVAGLGALLTVLTTLGTGPFGFLIPEKLRKPIATVIPILTTILTWLVPNDAVAVEDTSGA